MSFTRFHINRKFDEYIKAVTIFAKAAEKAGQIHELDLEAQKDTVRKIKGRFIEYSSNNNKGELQKRTISFSAYEKGTSINGS